MKYKGSFGVYVAVIAVVLGILFLVVALDRAVTDKWAYKKIADKQNTEIVELKAKVDMHSFNEAKYYEQYGKVKKEIIKQKKACVNDLSDCKDACKRGLIEQNNKCQKEVSDIKSDYTNKNLFKHGDRVFTIPSYSKHYRHKGRIYGKVLYEDNNGLVTIELSRVTKSNMLIHRQWLVLDDGSKEPIEKPDPLVVVK